MLKRLQQLDNYKLSEIYIYPVKSLGGISVSSAEVTDRGLKHDRRWMLVDKDNKFFTQRLVKTMALLQTEIGESALMIFNKIKPSERIEIPFTPQSDEPTKAVVWDDTVDVIPHKKEINDWFSEQLKIDCKLVYMPDKTERKVDTNYAKNNEVTSFADGYPFLIIGQESLNLLNSKLEIPLPMNRFRPNFVFTGGKPHDEDTWKEFKINEIIFKPVKPCARCVITTVNQDTAEQGVEPLKTLSTYRRADNNKVLFGMNLLHEGRGIVGVGESLEVLS